MIIYTHSPSLTMGPTARAPLSLPLTHVPRSHAKIARHRQKQELVRRQESEGQSSKPNGSQMNSPSSAPPRDMTENPVLHKVWVETAALLVKQVHVTIITHQATG